MTAPPPPPEAGASLAFLGRGWSFPPTFDPVGGTVVAAVAEQDIRQSLWIILTTRPGERVMLPTFGCDLASMLFTSLTTTTAREIAATVTRAIVEWEPRVTVIAVDVAEGTLDGWIDVGIDYCVRRTNSRSNLVFPFCRAEATLLPPEFG